MSPLLKLLLLTTFLNALSWIVLIPVWQYPDEQAHFAQVQFIAEKGGIPEGNQSYDTSYEVVLSEKVLGTERDNFGNNKFTYHPEFKLPYQEGLYGPNENGISTLHRSARRDLVKNEATLNPPLYYTLAAQVYKLFSWGDLFIRVYAIRIFSSLIFLLTVFTAYKIGQLIFDNSYLPLTLASLVAAKPMLVFASTGVLPDTLTILLFSIFILISLEILVKGWSTLKIIILTIIIILGAATRQHFLITLFILPIVIFHQLIFNKKSRIKIVATFLIFSLILFIASYFVPALDFIHRLDYPESSRKIPGNPLANMTYLDHFSWTIRHSIAEVLPWYWGVYKWLSLTLPPIVYQIINRLVPLAIIGLAIKTLFIFKKRDYKQHFWFFFFIFTISIYFMALTTFDFLYRKNNGFSFGIQGRYFFPLIIPQMALLLTGYWQLAKLVTKKFQGVLIFLLVLAIFFFNDYSLFYVASSYYETSTLTSFVNHVSYYKPEILKGNIILAILLLSLISQVLYLKTLALMSKTNSWQGKS